MLSREVTWTPLHPEQWTRIVHDGDEIRVGYIGGEAQGVHLDAPSPVTMFICRKYVAKTKCASVLLPKTYRVSHP